MFVFQKKSLFVVFFFLLSVVMLTFSSVRVGEKAIYTLAEKRLLPIYSVGRDDKKISISFDCAWGVEYTDEILDVMDEYGVKCTFFAVEFWVERYPEYAKKIVERGHELGTHSKTHPKMSELNEGQIREELTSSAKKIEEATGVYPILFRPPFGDYDNLVIEVSNQLGLYPIQWDVDSLDWKNLSKEEIYYRVEKRVKSGSIILCHNNGLHTAKSLPLIFSSLQNKGFHFVPIGELIYRENYTIDSQGKQRPNG